MRAVLVQGVAVEGDLKGVAVSLLTQAISKESGQDSASYSHTALTELESNVLPSPSASFDGITVERSLVLGTKTDLLYSVLRLHDHYFYPREVFRMLC